VMPSSSKKYKPIPFPGEWPLTIPDTCKYSACRALPADFSANQREDLLLGKLENLIKDGVR
jgi:hypothetical protein